MISETEMKKNENDAQQFQIPGVRTPVAFRDLNNTKQSPIWLEENTETKTYFPS